MYSRKLVSSTRLPSPACDTPAARSLSPWRQRGRSEGGLRRVHLRCESQVVCEEERGEGRRVVAARVVFSPVDQSEQQEIAQGLHLRGGVAMRPLLQQRRQVGEGVEGGDLRLVQVFHRAVDADFCGAEAQGEENRRVSRGVRAPLPATRGETLSGGASRPDLRPMSACSWRRAHLGDTSQRKDERPQLYARRLEGHYPASCARSPRLAPALLAVRRRALHGVALDQSCNRTTARS